MSAAAPCGPPALAGATARRVRMVVLDVDGVMTDGGVYMGATANGESVELKRFDVRDGLGIRLMAKAGLHLAIVSGRVSESTRLRAAELGVDEVHQDGGARKIPVIARLMEARGVRWEEVALLGDDLADLPALRRVGLPATVANGAPEVCEVALWQGKRVGGGGAVREFAEALLRARNEWTRLVDEYCRERDG